MAASASTIGPGGPYSDPPPPLRLLGEQLKHCSEALGFSKQKIRNPAKIAQEFDLLQMMRKCADYIQTNNGLRQFGKISVEEHFCFAAIVDELQDLLSTFSPSPNQKLEGLMHSSDMNFKMLLVLIDLSQR